MSETSAKMPGLRTKMLAEVERIEECLNAIRGDASDMDGVMTEFGDATRTLLQLYGAHRLHDAIEREIAGATDETG